MEVKKRRRPLLLKGETWFPQRGVRVSPRRIVTSLSNLIRYEEVGQAPAVKACSPESFRSWVRKWDSKI